MMGYIIWLLILILIIYFGGGWLYREIRQQLIRDGKIKEIKPPKVTKMQQTEIDAEVEAFRKSLEKYDRGLQ